MGGRVLEGAPIKSVDETDNRQLGPGQNDLDNEGCELDDDYTTVDIDVETHIINPGTELDRPSTGLVVTNPSDINSKIANDRIEWPE